MVGNLSGFTFSTSRRSIFADTPLPTPPVATGPSLGPELLVNGDFSDSSGWTLTGSTTISDGLGHINGGFLHGLKQDILRSGDTVEVSFDIVAATGAATYAFFFMGQTSRAAGGQLGTQTFREQITGGEGLLTFEMRAFGSFNQTISMVVDNVSVKKVLS